MIQKKSSALSAHIARVEGQLAAVRSALELNDCGKAARTLLAASRSLDSIRSTCISEFLTQRVYGNAPVKDAALLADIRSLIKA